MYKNYVFDLYGTLVDIHTDEEQEILWEKMALFYGYQGAFYAPEELHDSFYDLVQEMESAKKDKMEESPVYAHEAFPEIQIEYVFLELYRRKGIEKDLDFAVITGQFFRVLATEYVKLYDGVKEMFEALKKAGKKVYLLSNAQRVFTEYELKGLDIFKYFDDIFISSDCGTKKPDQRFFDLLIEKHALNPKECIMIGNDMSTDIAGAKAAGMDTFYIHSNISPELTKEPEAAYVLKEMNIKKVMEMLGFEI